MTLFNESNEEMLASLQWRRMDLSLMAPLTNSRHSMEELEEILLNSIVQNYVSPVILNELETLEERQIWRVTDAASEQKYTKACLLRFLGLSCQEFSVPLVRDQLIQALNSSLIDSDKDTIMGIFKVKSTINRIKLQTMEDVLQIDQYFQKAFSSKQYQERIYGSQSRSLKQPYIIDQSWIPAFIVCVTKLVIHMQQQQQQQQQNNNDTIIIEWKTVAHRVRDIVTESIANLGPGWIEAGIVLAAMVWMEKQDYKLSGLTALTIMPMLKDSFAMTALQKAAAMDKYTCLMFCLQKIIDFHTEEDVRRNFQELCYKLLLHHVITTTTATDRLKELERNLTTLSNALMTEPLLISSPPLVSSVTYCVIQHAMVCLALNRKDDFCHIARALEQSPAISDDDRYRVWDNWFQYLASFGGLFLETTDKQSQAYDQRRHDLTTTTQWMSTSSLDFFADRYVQLVEQTGINPFSSDDEKQYIRHASQQTVLRIFVNWGNTNGGLVVAIHRFLECFPSAFPAIAWGSGDEALTSAAVDFLMNREMEIPSSMLVDGSVDITILERRMILVAESEMKHQQVMLEAQEQQLLDLQARDCAAEQRRKWILQDEQSKEFVEIENHGGTEDLQPREEHATMSFESQEESHDIVKGTEGHTAADTEGDVIDSECEVEKKDRASDDVVEIDNSTDDEEGVKSVEEVGESEAEDEYSDDYNEDENMSDTYDDDQQNGFVGDHVTCVDEDIVHTNNDDHSEEVPSIEENDNDEGSVDDDDEEDCHQRLDDDDEYPSDRDDDDPEDIIEHNDSNDLDQEQVVYVELDDDDVDENPREVEEEDEEEEVEGEEEEKSDNEVDTNEEHLAPIPADDAFDDVNYGSTSDDNIPMVEVVDSVYLDADPDNNDVVVFNLDKNGRIDDDENMAEVVASEIVPRGENDSLVEIVGDEYDDCEARVLEDDINVVENADKGNEDKGEEGGNFKNVYSNEHDIKAETLEDDHLEYQDIDDEVSNNEADIDIKESQSFMTEDKGTEAVHDVEINEIEDQHKNQKTENSRIHKSNQPEDQEDMQDECTSFVDDQQEEEDGSQMDKGYEPDTAAQTEGDVSEEFQTEDEGNDNEEEHLTAEMGNAIPTDTTGVAFLAVNDYSDNHMDAADDQTVSDAGAESSGIEEGTCIEEDSQSVPKINKPSTILEYAFPAQLRSTSDCVGEELATHMSQNADCTQIFMKETIKGANPGEESGANGATVTKTNPPGNATNDSVICVENKVNSETFGDEMGTENLGVETIMITEIQDNETRSSNEVASEAGIDTEPERVESQPESEPATEQYKSVRDGILDIDSDATDEFPSTHQSPATDTNKTDYDADVSDAPRVDDDFEAAVDEVFVVQAMNPPLLSPAKGQSEKSVSFKEVQEFSAAVDNIPFQPNLPAPVQEVPRSVVVDAFRIGVHPSDEFKPEHEVADVDLSVDVGVYRLPDVAVHRPLLLKDTPIVTHTGDTTDTGLLSDVAINEDENKYHGVKDVNNPTCNQVPFNKRAHPVFLRDNSLMTQSGNPNDDRGLSQENQLIFDKLPMEEPDRSILIRNLPMMVQFGNISDDQSFSMEKISRKKEVEIKDQSDASIVLPIDPREWRTQSVHSASENRDTAADVIVESRLNYEIEKGFKVETSSQEKVADLLSSKTVPHMDLNEGANDDDMSDPTSGTILNGIHTESPAGINVNEVLANHTEKEITSPYEVTDLTVVNASVNVAISPVRGSMMYQSIDNPAAIQNPSVLLHEVMTTSALHTGNEIILSEPILRSYIDNNESSLITSEVKGSDDETEIEVQITTSDGTNYDDVTPGAGQSILFDANNEVSSAQVNIQINSFSSANDIVDITAQIDEQLRYERQNMARTTDDTLSFPILDDNKTSGYQATQQIKAENTPAKAEIVEDMRVSTNTKPFKSPLYGLFNTAGRSVLDVVKFLSPFKPKHGLGGEMETTTKRNEDEQLHMPHHCLQTMSQDHSFISSDLVHCGHNATDRVEVAIEVKELTGTPSNEESDPPFRTTRSRSTKPREKERKDSSSSQQPTRSSETKSRASTRVRKTTQPKKSKENTPASRRSSRRSEPFALSHDEGDVKRNDEAESNMEGLLVAFESQFSASPALSSIAPSSIASHRTRRRTSGVESESMEDDLRNSSTIVVTATAVFNDIEFEQQLPTISETIEEEECGVPRSKNMGMSSSNEEDDEVPTQSRLLRKRVHPSKARAGTEKVCPIDKGSSSKRPKGFGVQSAEEEESKTVKALAEFSPKKKRGRPAKSHVIKEDIRRKEKKSSLKSPKKVEKEEKETDGRIVKEPAELSPRKKRGRPAKTLAIEEVQLSENERYLKRAKESGMEPEEEETAIGIEKEQEGGGDGKAGGMVQKKPAESSPKKKRGRPAISRNVKEDVYHIETARSLKHPKRGGLEEKVEVEERIDLEQVCQSQNAKALKRSRSETNISEKEEKSGSMDEDLEESATKGKRDHSSKFPAAAKGEQAPDEVSTDEPPVNDPAKPAKKVNQGRAKKTVPVNTARQLRNRAINVNATDESSVVTTRSTRSRR